MRTINQNQVTFAPASLIDPVGRLFWKDGELYRAIQSDSADLYCRLASDLRPLFSQGLVETEVVPWVLEGYGLVLKHRRVPFTSYCMEWSSDMLRDAALLICDLSIELLRRGLILKDAHPWNILFDGGRPVFVDWGSIGAYEKNREWPYSEFRDRFLFPLYLMAAGRSSIARQFMLDTVDRPTQGDVFRLLFSRLPLDAWLRALSDDRRFSKSRHAIDERYFLSLRNTIQSADLRPSTTEWSNYDGPDTKYSLEPAENWPLKLRTVHELITRLNPHTVLDIGCNRGWFSQLASLHGSQVASFDIDECSINQLYRKSKAESLSITPLLMDFCRPTPAHGLALAYPSAYERFRVDMVLALAVTHHLVFKRGFDFPTIAGQLSKFANTCLVVEFVPPDDRYVHEWMTPQSSWYKTENFVNALSAVFRSIEVLPSSPPPRVILCCTKQKT